MKNIYVLPIDKPSRLYLGNNKNFVFGMMQSPIQSKNDDFTNQEIYITSDEEIKEGDWIYCTKRKLFGKVIEIQLAKFKSDTSMLYFEINNEEIWCKLFNCKKIILTTDQDLIKDGVQGIDDEFLEWFVKNPSCEEVIVTNLYGDFNPIEYHYEIIISKEEPKKDLSTRLTNSLKQFNLTLQEAINIESFELKTIGFGSKSVIEIQSLKNKRTLEEAVGRASIIEFPIKEWYKSDDYNREEITAARDGFSRGAKWQQERSYSEEEVRNIANWAFGFYRGNGLSYSELEDEFNIILVEKFKKE